MGVTPFWKKRCFKREHSENSWWLTGRPVHPVVFCQKRQSSIFGLTLLYLFPPCICGSLILYFSMLHRWVSAEDQLGPGFIDTAQHDRPSSSPPDQSAISCFFVAGSKCSPRAMWPPYQVQVSTLSPQTQLIYLRSRDLRGMELQSEHFQVTINGTACKAKTFWIGLTSQQGTFEPLG